MTRSSWIAAGGVALLGAIVAWALHRDASGVAGLDPGVIAHRPPEEPDREHAPLAADENPAAALATPQEEGERARRVIAGDLVHVTGHVIFPPGTPSDEVVQVVACWYPAFEFGSYADPGIDGESTSNEPDSFEQIRVVGPVRLNTDRGFDISVPRSWGSARVELRARWLYGSTDTDVSSDSDVPPLELHPELGARIEGELQPPATINEDELRRASGVAFLHDPTDALPLGHELAIESVTQRIISFECVPPGSGRVLRVALRGFVAADVPLPELLAGQRVRVAVPLERGGRVCGTVVSEDGAPIEGAEVQARLQGDARAYSQVSATSNDQGRFELVGLPAGQHRLVVSHSAHPDYSSQLAPLDSGQAVEGLRIVLLPLYSVEGVVVDESGEPVPNLDVVLAWPAHAETLSASASDGAPDTAGFTSEKSSERGEFRFEGIEGGPVTVSGVAGDRVGRAVLLLSPKTGTTVNTRLDLRMSASLFVYIEGEKFPVLPEAGIVVLDRQGIDFGSRRFRNRHDSRLQGGAGRGVRFGPLPPGEYHIVATHKDGRVAEDRVTLGGTEPVQVNLKFLGVAK